MRTLISDDWRSTTALTVDETAALLNASQSTILRMVREGELSAFRIGKSGVRIRPVSVMKLVDGEAAGEERA